MKKLKSTLIFSLLAIVIFVFIYFPLPAADLFIRVQFAEVEGDFCALYYTTQSSADFSQDKSIFSNIDYEHKQVTFQLDGSLKDQLTGLRLDFPESSSPICVRNISISSAGLIQKHFNPTDFFSTNNIVYANDLEAISLVEPRDIAYIITDGKDPHVLLSPALTQRITGCYSNYRPTRLGIVLFAAACCLMYKKNLFHKNEEL